MNSFNQQRVIETVSALFILLFVYTSVSKSLEFAAFRNTIQSFPIIGYYASFITSMVILSEVIIAFLLVFPFTRHTGLYGSLFLMIIFSVYIGYALLFESKLPCTCGGVLRRMNWTQHLFFNLFFTALALTGVLLINRSKLFIAINRRSRKTVIE